MLSFRVTMINACNKVVYNSVNKDTIMTDELMDNIVESCKLNLKDSPYKVHELAIREHVTKYILNEYGIDVWMLKS